MSCSGICFQTVPDCIVKIFSGLLRTPLSSLIHYNNNVLLHGTLLSCTVLPCTVQDRIVMYSVLHGHILLDWLLLERTVICGLHCHEFFWTIMSLIFFDRFCRWYILVSSLPFLEFVPLSPLRPGVVPVRVETHSGIDSSPWTGEMPYSSPLQQPYMLPLSHVSIKEKNTSPFRLRCHKFVAWTVLSHIGPYSIVCIRLCARGRCCQLLPFTLLLIMISKSIV
jgi:hypothetical protein